MKIGVASDHRGVIIKDKLIKYLEKIGYDVVDYGTNDKKSVDHPLYAFKLCEDVGTKISFGVLLCGTGIGMSIAANKVNGIRCAKVSSLAEAKLSRMHNNANVIALSSNMSLFKMKGIVKTFLNTDFLNEEKYIRRNNMVDNYASKL